MVLNAATHMVISIGKYEHITLVLRDTLHWLPVTVWIQFKIDALMVFDYVWGTGPIICPTSNLSCHSVRLAAETCLFAVQTRTSASEVSPLLLQSSGTHFHLISTHITNFITVTDSSNLSWKPTFSEELIIRTGPYACFSHLFIRDDVTSHDQYNISRDVYILTWRRFSLSACLVQWYHFASGSRVRLPPVAKFFWARGSVRLRHTVVGPYRVRSKVRVSI